MEVNSVNLMQYAVGGASLFILIAVGIIALFIKGRQSRIEKKEENARKKEEQSPLQQVNQKQQTNQRQQTSQKQQVSQPQKVVQQKEVAPNAVNNQNQQQEELQELQQRQIMHKLRTNHQEHVKQAMQSPPIQPRVNQEVEPRVQVQQAPKLSETKTLEIAFYKVQTTGRGENKAFFLDEYLNVGRTEGINDWVIDDDPTVSGNHCRIYQKDGEVYILDLRSTNGTYVNEERVFGEMRLENHDKIRMGHSTYRIKF